MPCLKLLLGATFFVPPSMKSRRIDRHSRAKSAEHLMSNSCSSFRPRSSLLPYARALFFIDESERPICREYSCRMERVLEIMRTKESQTTIFWAGRSNALKLLLLSTIENISFVSAATSSLNWSRVFNWISKRGPVSQRNWFPRKKNLSGYGPRGTKSASG